MAKGIARDKVIGIILVVLILAGIVSASAGAGDNSNFETLLTEERFQELMLGYFEDFSVEETHIHNEYITNEYVTHEHYNQTFLNQTFNDYMTMENIYNEYVTNNNYTYLNQTFNEFVQNNYTYVNQTFNDIFNDYNYFNQTFNDYVTNNFETINNFNQTFNEFNEFIEYNITNVYNEYFYEFVNETYNDYITNEYYEDNYYNTYQTFNQTYLNQTFIDNDYYETNYNYNESWFEQTLSAINNFKDEWLSSRQKIELEGKDALLLEGSNCSVIEFMFKDTMTNAILDNKGFIASTQLAQAQNLAITNSFFIDNQDEMIPNNMNVSYDKINEGKTAIEVDENNALSLDFNSDISSSEIIMNIAFQELWEDSEILTISQNGVPKLEMYIDNSRLYIKNLETGNKVEKYLNSLQMYNNYFSLWKLEFSSNSITFSVDNVEKLVLGENPFDSNHNININMQNNDDKNIYVRSVYVNAQRMEIVPDQFFLSDSEIDYDKSKWSEARIYVMDDSILYHINNEVVTHDLEETDTTPYMLNFDFTRSSVANIYCER